MMKYILILKDSNSYIEIPLTSLNIIENACLEDIDAITSAYTNEELKKFLLEEKIITEADLDKEFKIVYQDKDIKKEYSIITFNEKDALSLKYIIYFILSNITNKNNLKKLIEELNKKENSEELNDYLNMLSNIESMSIISFANGLTKIKYIPYEETRNIGIFIHNTLGFRIPNNNRKLILNNGE